MNPNSIQNSIHDSVEFTTRLDCVGDQQSVYFIGGLYHIAVPAEIAQIFTTGRPVRVVCLLNNVYERHGAIKSKGEGRFFIGFGKKVVEDAGLELGQELTVRMWRDDDAHGLDLPEELYEVLETDDEGKSLWNAVPPGRRRGWIRYVNDAKSETKRIERALFIVDKVKKEAETKHR